MKIDGIINPDLTIYPDAKTQFGWPAAKFKITGSGFGKAEASYVGLKIGVKVIALKTIARSDIEITVQVPDTIPSRLYFLGIFKTAEPLVKTNTIAGKVIVQPNPSKPVRANPALVNGPNPQTNTIPVFIALGPAYQSNADNFIPFFAQMRGYKIKYLFDNSWESFMTNTAPGYQSEFYHYNTYDGDQMLINYVYDPAGPGLLKPFTSEKEHMEQFQKMLNLFFPGDIYNFKVVFGPIPPDAIQQPFATVYGAAKVTKEYAGLSDGKDIFIGQDGLMIHEFAHRLRVLHHYSSDMASVAINTGEKCVMNKTDEGFCRACSMVMNLDWNKANENKAEAKKIQLELNSHFKPLMLS